MTENLFTRFSSPALHRNKVFLAPPGREAVTFAQAFDQAGRYAHVLAAHGAKKGDRVAVQVEKVRKTYSCIWPACGRDWSICR
jgi:acyl-coenzyme A synthetase/AMP-(fatty) acid ligase